MTLEGTLPGTGRSSQTPFGRIAENGSIYWAAIGHPKVKAGILARQTFSDPV
jgi:hypothetical protein